MTIKDTIVKLDRHVSISANKKSSCVSGGFKFAVAWIAYVLIGSWIFLVLEKSSSINQVENGKWTRFKELLKGGIVEQELYTLRRQLLRMCPHYSLSSSFDDLLSSSKDIRTGNLTLQDHKLDSYIEQTEAACDASLLVIEEIVSYPQWSFVDAVYYTMTLVTTIGFGHIYPTTDLGKIFSIVYAIAGVPLTCIVIAKSSDMLSNKMLHVYETAKKRSGRHPKTILYSVTWLFLILGCFVFMYLPSVAFATIEGWNYIDAIYFTFITLSTIGFGDYIAGYNDKPENKTYSDLYKSLIVMWIMVALGYWILLLNFLQKAIKSNAKTLKNTFKGKNITRQAEFLRQLMAKVKQQQNESDMNNEERLQMMAMMVESLTNGTPLHLPSTKLTSKSLYNINQGLSAKSDSEIDNEERLQMMAMMVESLTTRTSMNRSSQKLSTGSLYHAKQSVTRQPSSYSEAKSASANQINEEVINEGLENSESETKLPPIRFRDLMKINVALKAETLPAIESLVSGAGNGQGLSHFVRIGQQGQQFVYNNPNAEISLPLRDVIGITLLVASMEENQTYPEEDDDSQSVYSTTNPIIDPKESVPLLRSFYFNQDDDQDPDQKIAMKETIKNAYFESALNHYLEETDDVKEVNFETPEDENQRRTSSLVI